MNLDHTLYDRLMSQATKDGITVTPQGQPTRQLTHGVTIKRLVTHTDDRGTVTELFDPRWNFHPDPLVFAYTFSIRPGIVKGWNLHKRHEDRYALVSGELELVLFDPRSDSPTFGQVCRIRLSELDRCIVNVPQDIWHADYNIGQKDVVVVNFPTMAYDYANPDKYRLPIDTPLIPYRFPSSARGG